MLDAILALKLKPSDWVFSIKMAFASLLALFLALAFDLDRPVWAMATVYIVANPMSGVLASKALYRVLGTFFGAVGAIIMVPNLVASPVLLTLAMALWVTCCLFLARLDRTPKSYVFMLAGYTAAIVGFPSVSDPSVVLTTGIDRFQEISLGILCATLVSHTVFPRHIGPVIAARTGKVMTDLTELAVRSLNPDSEEEKLRNDRARIAADIGDLHGLSVHLHYEKSGLSGRTRELHALQNSIAALLPILYAATDRISAIIQAKGKISKELQEVLDAVSAYLSSESAASDLAIDAHKKIAGWGRQFEHASDWVGLLQLNLTRRLHRLIEIHQDCKIMWEGMQSGDIPEDVLGRWQEHSGSRVLHKDFHLAWRSAVTAGVAVLVVCSFWIVTGWQNGSTAAMMAAVSTSIMSFLDNPVPAIKGFIRYTILAVGMVLVYSLFVLPGIDGFPLLALAFAPFLLLLGVLIVSPSTYGFGLAVLVNMVMILNVDTTFSSNIPAVLGGGIASVIGFIVGAIATAFFRVLGVDGSIRRLEIANWHDISAVARGKNHFPRLVLVRRLLDRQGLILPRLAQAPGHSKSLTRAMPEVTLATSFYDLRRLSLVTSPEIGRKIRSLLNRMADHFDARAEDFDRLPEEDILAELDDLLRDVIVQDGVANRTRLLVPLIALRRTMSKEDEPRLLEPANDVPSPSLPGTSPSGSLGVSV